MAQNISLPPYVTDAPDSQTLSVGQTASFTVAAVGQPPDLRYQWQIKSTGTTAFRSLANGGSYSGVTTPTLTVTGVTAAMSGDLFQCLITNGAPPDAITAPVSLAVLSPPLIATQPASQSVNPNGTATFSVTANGSGTLSYQWRKDASDLAGATNASLTLTNVQATNAGSYTVVVTNIAGTVTSQAANLTLSAGAPTITTHPAGQTVIQGANVSLAVTAASTATVAYQWRKDGANIAGATAATLALPNIQANSAGTYSVVVTNAAGSVTSSSAILIVNTPPTITSQPGNNSASPGATVTFSVAATGTAPLAYQWRKDGALIAGATGTSYAIAGVTTAAAGNYSVVVTNLAGSATSANATLTLTIPAGPPIITTQPVHQAVAPGGSVTLSVAASGTGTLSYQWTKNGLNIPGATTSAYSITNAQLAHSGRYHVTVANSSGATISAPALLNLSGILWGVGSDHIGQLGSDSLLMTASPLPLVSGVQSAAAGANFVAFIKPDGSLWTMGENASSQLGTGNTLPRSSPYRLASDVATASAYNNRLMYLKKDGTLWITGWFQPDRDKPVQIASGVKSCATGAGHAMYVTTSGELWAFGDNRYGQLGDVTISANYRNDPIKVATSVVQAAAGGAHSVFLKSDGSLWAMGRNASGQLGDGTKIDRSQPIRISSNVTSASAGDAITVFIRSDATLWGMGENVWYARQLGLNTADEFLVPTQISSNVAAAAVSTGPSIFRKSDGTIWTMGLRYYGAVGDGVFAVNATPGGIPVNIAGRAVGTPISGGSNAYYITEDGTLWGTGSNIWGPLGRGRTPLRFAPITPEVPSDVGVVSSGVAHTLILTVDGKLWSTGDNAYWSTQLGDGTDHPRSRPGIVTEGVTSISAGQFSTFYIKSDRTLWACGGNGSGQYGDGTFNGRSTPIKVASNVAFVSNYGHTLFITDDGVLMATGDSSYGQLGDGTLAKRNTPIAVASGVANASAGSFHSLFIKHDSTLWAMGRNDDGQLGDGTLINRSSPVQIMSGVAAAAAANSHSLILKQDGTLWATGNGGPAKGDGTYTLQKTPIRVATDVIAIAAQDNNSRFLKSDGTLWGMGNNWHGQLAMTAGNVSLVPVLIASNVASVAMGGISTLFVQMRTGGTPPAITASPVALITSAGESAELTVAAKGSGPLGYQWYKDGAALPGAKDPSCQITYSQAADAGFYHVVVFNNAGSVTSSVANLTVNPPPAVSLPTAAQSVAVGGKTTLTATPIGSGPFTYQWRKNGASIAGATAAIFTIAAAQAADAGNYTLAITNPYGTTESSALILSVATNPGRLVNLSILTAVAAGETMTLGTVLGGTGTGGPKPLLIRAVGPTLGLPPFNVPGVMSDPKLAIYSGQTVSGSNDNWGGATSLSSVFGAVGAFAYSSASSRDAAVYNPTMASGAYTVQVSGTGSGAVLAELYDATASNNFTNSTPRLINVSVLKLIGTGSTLTAGFVVAGSGSKTVLIRAVGPGLAAFGVAGTMADPKLDLYSGSNVIASNDNWGGSTTLVSAFSTVGAFALPATSKDAAILITLPPGNYTAQVAGVAGSGGSALVEVYEVP